MPTPFRTWLTAGVLISTSAAYDLAQARVIAKRAFNGVSDTSRRRFSKNGVLIIKSCTAEVPHPLTQQGCPRTIEEFAGVEAERRLAAALACALLRTDAVRDPIGEFGTGCTHAHDHYAYASILDAPKRSCVVVLPREPTTLTMRGYPEAICKSTQYSSSSFQAAIFAADDDELDFCEVEAQRPEPEFHLDAGDAMVLRGDRTEPPGGLGGGSLVYHFAACEASDKSALYLSPLLDARKELLRGFAMPEE